MNLQSQHKIYGTAMDVYISQIPGELPQDAVGLWQIVPAGRDGFGLAGGDLINFVRLGLRALMENGAVPVRHNPSSGFVWDIQNQYGQTSEDIISTVIEEWLAMPDDPLILCGEGVWFALPRPGKNYVKMN